MLWYLVKLLVLLPVIGLLAWACLVLTRKMQERATLSPGSRSLRIVETLMLSPTQRLAVIAFHDREILVVANRQGLTRLAEAPARPAFDTIVAAKASEP